MPDPEDVDTLSADLDVISISSGEPSPSDTHCSSKPPSRQHMVDELPAYNDRDGIRQSGMARRPGRGGRNIRLGARLMAESADEEYNADSDVLESRLQCRAGSSRRVAAIREQ